MDILNIVINMEAKKVKVMEYFDEGTKIRIHDDYVKDEEKQVVKEMLISIMINYLEKNNCSNMME